MTITYVYGENLYINLTNRCPNACDFCLRATGDHVGNSGNLWLEHEPTKEEILSKLQTYELNNFKELVFCGFGEPTYRLDVIVWVASQVRLFSAIKIRVNTNGLSDLIHGRDTTVDFQKNIDEVSISLNASTPELYDALCHSEFGLDALPAILTFTRNISKIVPIVTMTVVDTMSESEQEACKKLCESVYANFHVRHYSEDWQG